MSKMELTEMDSKNRYNLVVLDDRETFGGTQGAMVVLNALSNRDDEEGFDFDEKSRLIPIEQLLEFFLENERKTINAA